MKSIYNLIIIMCLFTASGYAQELSNTISIEGEVQSPPATIDAISFIAGHWHGEAFGGLVEEVWTPPVQGAMMCAFKSQVEDQPKFYEIVTITEENGTLIKRLRHFDPHLKAWEEKDKPMEILLVKVEDNRVYFNGFTYEKVNDDGINVYVVLENKDGSSSEMKFNYKRVK